MEKRIAVVAPPQKSERLRSNNTPAENESWKMVPWLRPNPRIIQIVLFYAQIILRTYVLNYILEDAPTLLVLCALDRRKIFRSC